MNAKRKRTNRRRQENHEPLRIEKLEPRSMLTSASFFPLTGILNIFGSPVDDVINISRTVAGQILVDGVPVSTATVTNTSSISVNAGAGQDKITIDMTNGSFAPGRGAESGIPEIEFNVDGNGGGDRLIIIGQSGDDRIDIGSNGINLNDDNDVDITIPSIVVVEVKGQGGNDVIRGFGGPVTGLGTSLRLQLEGGAGNDLLVGGNNDDLLIGNDGDDRLVGLDGNDSLIGGSGVNSLSGNSGNDSLFAENGIDSLNGGAGIDQVNIIPSIDRQEQANVILADRDPATGKLNIEIRDVNGTSVSQLQARLVSIERWNVRGGKKNDVIDFSKLGVVDIEAFESPQISIVGGDGDDRILGSDFREQIVGDNGNDEIFGNGGDDLLIGGLGNDRVNGGDGNDTILGGDGDDILNGNAGNDVLEGGAGDDFLNGQVGNDRLFGNEGNDTINGNNGNDRIEGGDGNDLLIGGNGDDFILGGAGNDTLNGNAGNDELRGGDGDDLLDGGPDDDRLFGENGNDTLIGGGGNDFLDEGPGQGGILIYGTPGNDVILVGRAVFNGVAHVITTINGFTTYQPYVNGETIIVHAGAGNDVVILEATAWNNWQAIFHGGDGNDSLHGGLKNDQLYGEAGNDWLFGLSGNDILVGGDGDDWLYGHAGRDLLIGGNGTDSLFGGLDDDIVIGGRTDFDANAKALSALSAQWISAGSYASRTSSITSGNGVRLQKGTTVFDDGQRDYLYGELGRDLFFADLVDHHWDRSLDEILI